MYSTLKNGYSNELHVFFCLFVCLFYQNKKELGSLLKAMGHSLKYFRAGREEATAAS